jgi:hypothetical protein
MLDVVHAELAASRIACYDAGAMTSGVDKGEAMKEYRVWVVVEEEDTSTGKVRETFRPNSPLNDAEGFSRYKAVQLARAVTREYVGD